MGCYDQVFGRVTCPSCGNKTIAEEQFKLLGDKCCFAVYTEGDAIDLEDGIYSRPTATRKYFISKCGVCGEYFNFSIAVKDKKIIKIFAKHKMRLTHDGSWEQDIPHTEEACEEEDGQTSTSETAS